MKNGGRSATTALGGRRPARRALGLITRIAPWLCAASVAAAEPAPAPPDSLLTYELGEIIVTADRWRDGIHVRTEMLGSKELDARPGHNAAELLGSLPGVEVSTGQKDEADIIIRGFGSRRVAVMVDGRPMNLPYYGTFNAASLSSDNLDRIVVVKGPASVTYGPNVMGGVVNFVTARGRERPGTRLDLRAGTHDTGHLRLSHGGVRGAWDYLVSVRGAGSGGSVLSHRFQPSGYPGTEDGGLRNDSDFSEWDVFAKVGRRAGDKTDWALSCGYHTLEKGVPAAVDEERYWRFTDWRRAFGDLTLSRQISPATSLEAKGYGDVFINTLVDYEDETYDEDAVFYDSTHDTWDLGGILALEHDWSRSLHGTYGLSVREDQIKKRMNPGDPWLYHHQVTGSVHAEHRGWVTPTVTGAFGLSDNFMVFNHLEDVEHAPGFSAGLTWRAARGWAVFGSAGRGTRFPTLSQLWSTGSGNRDLKPETTLRTELGVDGALGRGWAVDGALFWNDLENLIDRDLRRAGRYRNIRSARTWGAEVGGSVRPAAGLTARLSYTYTKTENRETGEPLDLVPEHKLDVKVTALSSGGDTEWVLVASRVGERFESDAYPSNTLPAYVTADCKVGTRLHPHLVLSMEVFNVADANYEKEVGFPAPGRTVLVSTTLTF